MAHKIADAVLETTLTVGTGPLALVAAEPGYKRFGDVLALNDTTYYAVAGINAAGQRTGEWETGVGTYSAANQLTRTAVITSSNGNNLVNFSAGVKAVYIAVPATKTVKQSVDGTVTLPAGLAVAGSVSAGVGATISALSPNGSSQAVLAQSDAGSMDLTTYKGVGGGSLRVISGDAVGNEILLALDRTELRVSGDVRLGWDKEISFAYDANYFQTLNCASGQREMQFLNASSDTRADFVWMNSKTGAANLAERMRLSVDGLSVAGTHAITCNLASHALSVDNANPGGYGIRIRNAGVGGEPALSVENAAGSATVFRVLNNGAVIGSSGVFDYGLELANNNGVVHFRDGAGNARRAILRATDQFLFGDIDNNSPGSWVSFCANDRHRFVVNGVDVGLWNAGGLTVNGLVNLGDYTNGTEPAAVAGCIYYNTTIGKAKLGGAGGWETVTSV